MRHTFIRIALAALLIVCGAIATAQSESEPPPENAESETQPTWTLNASLEGYYEYNFNEP